MDVLSPTPKSPTASTPSAPSQPAETAAATVSPSLQADAVATFIVTLAMAVVPDELPVYSQSTLVGRDRGGGGHVLLLLVMLHQKPENMDLGVPVAYC